MAGFAIPSDKNSTVDKSPGDIERASAQSMLNPRMVLGYNGVKSLGDRIAKLATPAEAELLLGKTLLGKIAKPSNIGVPISLPISIAGARQVTFYDGTNKNIASMTFQNFKAVVEKVRASNPVPQTCK